MTNQQLKFGDSNKDGVEEDDDANQQPRNHPFQPRRQTHQQQN